MLSKTSFLLMVLAFFWVACQEAPVVTGTALPTVTEMREGVVAAATPTLPPSTPTPLLPFLTPSRTPMPTVPPHPTNTPTLPPQTPPPTLPPVTPLPSSDDYQLKPWLEQDMLDALALAEATWQRLNAEYYKVDSARLDLALLKKEILWRNPQTILKQDLEWQITYDLAMAGQQEASLRLVPILEQVLAPYDSLEPEAITFLNARGFLTELIAVSNLFGDNQIGWILILGARNPRSSNNSSEGEAIFAIRRIESQFTISMVASLWSDWPYRQFTVSVEDHTNDGLPEIIVEHEISGGNGPGFAQAGICIYQWNSNEWHSLLSASSGKPCFAYGGYLLPKDYLTSTTDTAQQLDITTRLNPGLFPFCIWNEHYVFTWNETDYVLNDIWLDMPSQLQHPDELVCVEESWSEAIQTGDQEKLVTLMENILANWPEAVQLNDIVRDFLRYETEFEWVFRFQLGRYYALIGDLVKAESFLAEVARQPLSNFESPWPTRAQIYLDNLGDVEQAEMLLTEFNQSIATAQPFPPWTDVDQVSFELANQLFAGDAPQSIVTELETLIAGQCTENRYCGWPYYVLGLTYEAAGDEVNAVAAYWQVWHDYPNSYYATVAQYRLVEKE